MSLAPADTCGSCPLGLRAMGPHNNPATACVPGLLSWPLHALACDAKQVAMGAALRRKG